MLPFMNLNKSNTYRKSRYWVSRMIASVLPLSLLCTYVLSYAAVTKLSSEDQKYLLRADALTGISTVNDIPAPVLLKFAEIAKDPNLKIANPGEKFQVTDVILEKGLPWRRLIFGGISKDFCMIHYERGGYTHSYYVVLFKRSGNDASFLWGAASRKRIKDLSEFRDLLKAGALDDSHLFYW